jgi:hypothetical protein
MTSSSVASLLLALIQVTFFTRRSSLYSHSGPVKHASIEQFALVLDAGGNVQNHAKG